MDDLRDFARRYTEAWCSQDPTKVAAFFSPHASFSVNRADPSVGHVAITELARGFMTTFPDLQALMDDVVARSNWAEYHWTLIGAGRRVRISDMRYGRSALMG